MSGWRDSKWTDGMGRVTIKGDTRGQPQYSVVQFAERMIGVVRAPGWLVIYGPYQIQTTGVTAEDLASGRERIAERARYRRQQRHGPRYLRSHGYGPPTEIDHAEDGGSGEW